MQIAPHLPYSLAEGEENNQQSAENTGYSDALQGLCFMGDEFRSTRMLKAYKKGYEEALGRAAQTTHHLNQEHHPQISLISGAFFLKHS